MKVIGKTKETKRIAFKGHSLDEVTGIFEGYASVFGNLDSDGDIIEKGAYEKFLKGDWSRVKILALHNDEWLPIGVPLELYEDDNGLYIKAKISDTSMGRDVIQLILDGVLRELSIGYIVLDAYKDNDGYRHLTELELLEVSVVTWAANDQAKILGIKQRDGTPPISPEFMLEMADELERTAARLRNEAKRCTQKEVPKRAKSYSLPPVIGGGLHRRR